MIFRRPIRTILTRGSITPRIIRTPPVARLVFGKPLQLRPISTMFPPPQQSHRLKYFSYSLLGAVAVLYGYWKYITWHNYPLEVAQKLREGLYAEGTAGGLDYKKALVCYLEALEEADKVGLHALSDEYTGLQLKVAEMYEKLNMLDEARHVYQELGTAYIQALTDGKSIPDHLRPHVIQRDLRVALKTAHLESTTNAQMAKMSLMVHILVAQEEVAKRSPEMAELIKGRNTRKDFNIPISLDEKSKAEHLAAWQPFRDELFNARDVFVSLCMATGDIGLAIQTKLASTEWMSVSGYEVSETLMSFYNAGAIFYLQGEELEVREHQGKETVSSDGAQTSTKNMATISMENASACFTMILSLIAKLPNKLRRDGEIDEVHALTTYGLGVIALHKGEFDQASDLLRESRLRAKGCGYESLVLNSEQELSKLEKLRKAEDAGLIEEASPLPPISLKNA